MTEIRIRLLDDQKIESVKREFYDIIEYTENLIKENEKRAKIIKPIKSEIPLLKNIIVKNRHIIEGKTNLEELKETIKNFKELIYYEIQSWRLCKDKK